MRHVPGSPIAFVLAILLVSLTPMGTGAGAHQFDLLHPLFSHVHIVNGQVLTHEQLAQGAATSVPTPTYAGLALGAGSGANPAWSGLGISPTLPMQSLGLPLGPLVSGLALELDLPAGRFAETPPDPPPTPTA